MAKLSVRDDDHEDDDGISPIPAAVADSPTQPTSDQHPNQQLTPTPTQHPPQTLQTRLKKLNISLTHIESFLSLSPIDTGITQLPATPGLGDAAFDEMLQGRVSRIVGAIEGLARAGQQGRSVDERLTGHGQDADRGGGLEAGTVAVWTCGDSE